MTKLRGLLRNRPAVRSVGELLLGSLIAHGISVVSMPILTRLYTPESYGIFGTYSALVSILSIITTLRYEFSILLPPNDEDAERLVAVTLFISCVMFIIIGSILWITLIWMNPAVLCVLRPYIGILSLSILFCGVSQAFAYRLIRYQQFRVQMRASLAQSLTYLSIQVTGGLLRVGTYGLIAAQLIGQAVYACISWRKKLVLTRQAFSRELIDRYSYLVFYDLPAALIYILQSQLPVLATTGFYSVKEAGWLLLSLRVIEIPSQMLTTSLGRVYLSRAAGSVHQSPESLYQLATKAIKWLALLGFVPTLLLMTGAPLLFTWLFGAGWRTSGEYLQILAPLLLVNLIVSPLYNTLTVLRKSRLLLKIEALRATMVLLSFWLPALTGQPFQVAVWAYMVSYFMTQLFFLTLMLKALRSLLSAEV